MESAQINPGSNSHASANRTICAISTPHGIGGIAVARLSGPHAIALFSKIWHGSKPENWKSHTTHLGTVIDTTGQPLDQAVATIFRAPKSFTGQDTIEISVHGSRYIQRELIDSLTAAGAQLAEPGEFTRLAFTSGRIDLTQAEAVADMIASSSRAAHRIAISQMAGGFSRRLAELRSRLIDLTALLELELDFSEEDVEFADRTQLISITETILGEITRLKDSYQSGKAIKEGIPVAIIGATNAGKSSLLNALLDDDRAIVSDIHGTTRDTIEETLTLGDYTFRFIDTAGIRHTDNPIEQTGIDRTHRAIAKARIIIALSDVTLPLDTSLIPDSGQISDARIILALNKTDLPANPDTIKTAQEYITLHPHINLISISALTNHGITDLRNMLIAIADSENTSTDDILITNARHAQALAQAHTILSDVLSGLRSNLSADLVAQDLRAALSTLAEITGDIPSAEILSTIFSRFCIGK